MNSADPAHEVSPEFVLLYFKSKALSSAVKRISPRIWAMSAHELELSLNLTPLDYKLKLRLWDLISTPSVAGQFKAKLIYDGLCSYTHFFHGVLNNPEKVSWMIKPGVSFAPALEALQKNAIFALRNLVDSAPLLKADGTVDTSTANFLLDALDKLHSISKTK